MLQGGCDSRPGTPSTAGVGYRDDANDGMRTRMKFFEHGPDIPDALIEARELGEPAQYQLQFSHLSPSHGSVQSRLLLFAQQR